MRPGPESPVNPGARLEFREAAAVVLIRGGGASLEVFWVRRGERVSFMPGFHAFAGGTLLPEDEDLPIEGDADGAGRVLRACAIREAFEETGVLLGLEAPVPAAALSEPRSRLLAGEACFAALARAHGWRFRAGALADGGRWQTPPFSAARFDTAFFLARLPRDQQPSIRAGELESGEWIESRHAIERWRRGEVTFAPPVLHTLRELEAGEEGLSGRLASAPARAVRPVRRIELKWGIVLHPMKTRPLPPATHTNAYLVGESEMALIDPASGDAEELRALFELMDALGADGRRLKFVLMTHGHPDHAGGVAALRERYRVPVAAHAEIAPGVAADIALGDGETIALAPGVGAWDLRAIHTPGHARGHLCFLNERTRSLFTGDHILGGAGTAIIDPPEGDMAAHLASLERLLAEPVETLFPGHGSPQGAAVRRIRALIAHRRGREAKVLAALEREPLALTALVERVYADTPRDLWSLAGRSLLAHLLKLEAEGRARREGDRWREGGS